jgi:NADH-quinone oxidoreductase E subunit
MSVPSAKRIKDVSEAFQFSSENLKKIEKIIAKYPQGRQASAVLPLLDLAQRQCGGWLPQLAIEEVAHLLKMPVIRVFEVASFYTMLNLTPVGKYHLQLCGTTPCWLRGAAELKEVCSQKLGIQEGEITPDGKFSLVEVECLGACVNAPVVQINDDFYEDLTPESFVQILEHLAKGHTCNPGSQIGRHNSAPLGHEQSSLDKTSPTKPTRNRKKAEVVSAE